tara:strand:- start:189 stop:509 length:321 start_codon:yes stop_codon:yes gene_type:complete
MDNKNSSNIKKKLAQMSDKEFENYDNQHIDLGELISKERKKRNKKKSKSGGKKPTTSSQKKTNKKEKTVRKHRGIYQDGNKKGKLKPGFRYTGKNMKSGIPEIKET